MNRMLHQPNIARAIARSSAARSAQTSRRRRSVALAALLSVGLAGAGTFSIGALTGNDVVQAAVNKAQNLADLIGQRSPGQRTEAQLTKTKHARALAKQRLAARTHAPAAPIALTKATMADIANLLAPPAPIAVDLPKAFPAFAIAAPTPLLALVGTPGGPIGSPPGGGGGSPGGGGGSPGGGGGTPGGGSPPIVTPPTQVPELTPPASPLPEPGTWATMLLGFALIGWRARHSRGAAPAMQRA